MLQVKENVKDRVCPMFSLVELIDLDMLNIIALLFHVWTHPIELWTGTQMAAWTTMASDLPRHILNMTLDARMWKHHLT